MQSSTSACFSPQSSYSEGDTQGDLRIGGERAFLFVSLNDCEEQTSLSLSLNHLSSVNFFCLQRYGQGPHDQCGTFEWREAGQSQIPQFIAPEAWNRDVTAVCRYFSRQRDLKQMRLSTLCYCMSIWLGVTAEEKQPALGHVWEAQDLRREPRAWQPTPGLLPGESPVDGEPGGPRPVGSQQSDTAEPRLSTARARLSGGFRSAAY